MASRVNRDGASVVTLPGGASALVLRSVTDAAPTASLDSMMWRSASLGDDWGELAARDLGRQAGSSDGENLYLLWGGVSYHYYKFSAHPLDAIGDDACDPGQKAGVTWTFNDICQSNEHESVVVDLASGLAIANAGFPIDVPGSVCSNPQAKGAVIDISNPQSPRLLSTYEFDEGVANISLSGRTAIGVVAAITATDRMPRYGGCYLRAFTVSGEGELVPAGSVALVDVEDPASPLLIEIVPLRQAATSALRRGDRLIVTTDNTLQAIPLPR